MYLKQKAFVIVYAQQKNNVCLCVEKGEKGDKKTVRKSQINERAQKYTFPAWAGHTDHLTF